MVTPEDISRRLGNLALSTPDQPEADLNEQIQKLSLTEASSKNTNLHLLSFDFPALDLLSDQDAVYLPEPHLVDWRPRPGTANFHLEMWDPLDLFHYMDPAVSKIDQGEIQSERARSFVSAVESLAGESGSSTLSVITHVTNGEARVRMCISSTLDNAAEQTRTRLWDLSVSDWEAIMSIPRPWIEVLGDVVYRKTTRSFLAADEKLRQYSQRLHQKDSAAWARHWQTGTPRSAKRLLFNYLRHLQSDKVLSFEQLEDDGTVRLPCGHDIYISEHKIDALPEDECRNVSCFFCGSRILPAAAFEEAKMNDQCFRLFEASANEEGWARLHEWIKDDSEKVFSKSALIQAIPAAVASLKLPEIVESAHMSPVSFKETAVSLEAIHEWLEKQPETINRSPLNLVNQLEDIALERLLDTELPFPPAWQTFLKVALNRAVNLAILRRCTKLGADHFGVHLHARNVFVSVVETSLAEAMFEEDEHGDFDAVEEPVGMDVDD